MDQMKQATRFVERLVESLLRNGELTSYEKRKLRLLFDAEVQKINECDFALAEFLNENQHAYRKLFIRLVKNQLKNSSNLKSALAKDKNNELRILPYNLFTSTKLKKKKIAKKSSSDCQCIYSAYLYERLNHIQNCDDVVKLFECCQSLEKVSWFADIRKVCTIVNFRMEPKVLQHCMDLFYRKLSEKLEKSSMHEKSLMEMKSFIEDFVTFCTRKHEEIKDFSTKPNYNDLLAAIVSMYIDVILLIFHNKDESEKKKAGKRLCGWVCYVFCSHPDFALDALIQVSKCSLSDGPIVLPLCKKSMAKPTGEFEPAFYTKYIIAVCQYAKQFPEPMSDILAEARTVAAPHAYLEWLRAKDASIAELLVAKNRNKKTRITKYLLENADEELLSRLLDLLTVSDGRGHVVENILEDVVPAIAKSSGELGNEGDLEDIEVAFCIDRQPDKDLEIEAETEQLISSDQQNEESSEEANVEAKDSENDALEKMEVEEFEGDDFDEKNEEMSEKEKDKKVEDEEEDVESENENIEEKKEERIEKEEEELVEETVTSDEESEKEWKLTMKKRTVPQKVTTDPQKKRTSPQIKSPSPQKAVAASTQKMAASPQQMSSSPYKIVASTQKITLHPYLDSSSESPEEEAESKKNELEEKTLEEERKKSKGEEELVENSEKGVENVDENIVVKETESEKLVEIIEAILDSEDVESDEKRVDKSNETDLTNKNSQNEKDTGELDHSVKELQDNASKVEEKTVDTGSADKSFEKCTKIHETVSLDILSPSASPTEFMHQKRRTTVSVSEDSTDERQHEELINKVLHCIDSSDVSEKDMFEEFEGILPSSQQKGLAESEKNTSVTVGKTSSPPKIDPTVLKSPKHKNDESSCDKISRYDLRKHSPASTASNIFSPPLVASKQQKRSSSAKSVIQSRQDGHSTPDEKRRNFDETLIPDSSERSTPEHKKESVANPLVPDLSKFLQYPHGNKDVYDYESDTSPIPRFTRILMRYNNSDVSNPDTCRNTTKIVSPKSPTTFSSVISNSSGRKNSDKHTASPQKITKSPQKMTASLQKITSTPQKITASPTSNSPENVAPVDGKNNDSARDGAQNRRRSSRILQMQSTSTKESISSSPSRKRRVSSSSNNSQKTKILRS